MKILMVCYNKVYKGSYWRAFNFSKSLARKGHEVYLIATSEKNKISLEEKRIDNVQIVLMPDLLFGSLRSGWDLYNVVRRILWMRGKKFDLIHGFDTRPTVIIPILWARKRIKHIFLDWADWLGKGGSIEERVNPLVKLLLRPIETFFENKFRLIPEGTTVICNCLYERAIALGVDQMRIKRIVNGSDLENFYPVPIDQARKNEHLNSFNHIVGYLGTIFYKDALLMIDTINEVHKTNPKILFLIIGYFPFDIKKLIANSEFVIMTGALPIGRVNYLLNACDILWLPLTNSIANQGRLPLKLTDYLAIGKPIISSDVGDISLVFSHENIGILCEPDFREHARNILALLSNEGLRKIMGGNARYIAETQYNWEKRANELEVFYDHLIKD